ncbi:class I SAM-dependent methyltransferase [Pseudacidovorax intermedius]|uniref:class I SAM-dependent methyltransferase n=1 Tax=Pseudacidovorax intermedius TaxID=433924 RepID=UPI0025DA2074|nr:SAM-dependent methyltransferase [Pseudacidovorax intermedius]
MGAVSTPTTPPSVPTASSSSAACAALVRRAIERDGGWLPFDRFMALALYAPGLGYYAHGSRKFGHLPQSGSDFVTAPELSPLFGQSLAVAVADAFDHTGTDEVWEFGAGSGALAAQLLESLGERVARYTIVDLSGALRARQQERLAPWAGRVRWVDALPDAIEGVVVGNEVLDAMPVQLLVRRAGQWLERGVTVQPDGAFGWDDRPTGLRPPVEPEGPQDYLTEVHPQARAFIATLAERLKRGAAYFLDYGFPESEYYHPQRHMGTLMCHQAHRSDDNPLVAVGDKDITAHVDFTGVALAGQDAGLEVLGYTSQARFLLDCGLPERMMAAPLAERALAARLIHEHEMGELFKVLAFAAGESWDAVGFRQGDRSHTL